MINRPLFIWIPKTGGTSVMNAFREKDRDFIKNKYHKKHIAKKLTKGTHGHSYLKAIYTDEELENFYKFTVVRNPYARLVSLYRFYFITRSAGNHRKFYLDNKMESFNSFAMSVIENDLIENAAKRPMEPMITTLPDFCIPGRSLHISPTRPQNEWLKGINNVKVYRTENLEQLFRDFDLENRRDNITPASHAGLARSQQYTSYYNYDLVNLVNEFYREDFESFGYRML